MLPNPDHVAIVLRRYAYSPSWFTLSAAVAVLADMPSAASIAKLTHLWKNLLSGVERQKLFGRRHREHAVLALLQQALSFTRGSGSPTLVFRRTHPSWEYGETPEHAALILADASFRDGKAGIGVWFPGRRAKLQISVRADSSAVAEALAVQYAVETGCAMGLSHMRVMTDCAFVVQALNREEPGAAAIRRALDQARPAGVSIEKAPRPFMAKADALAYSALYLAHPSRTTTSADDQGDDPLNRDS